MSQQSLEAVVLDFWARWRAPEVLGENAANELIKTLRAAGHDAELRTGRLTEARWTEAVTKTEDGEDFPAAAYAYVPDATKPSTWKIRLWANPTDKVTASQVGAAVAAIGKGFRGNKADIPASAMPGVRAKVRSTWKQIHGSDDDAELPAALKESMAGGRSFDEMRSLVGKALQENTDGWPWLADIDDENVVYESGRSHYKCPYSVDNDGNVSFGEPIEVEPRRHYEPVASSGSQPAGTTVGQSSESVTDRIHGRVVESKGTDAAGGRVFGVQIIEFGDSRNGRRYPQAVMTEAASKYEGAKAYDHHRTDEELKTSTIQGMVGHYENVTADGSGLQGDLHLLPGATHTAEALDASLAAQKRGLSPLVGISHDVQANYRPITVGTKRMLEATEIVSVNSADVVADPAAGGKATRMVAGGTDDTDPEEGRTMTLKELLALLRGATAEKRAELLTEHKALLDDFGLDEAAIGRVLTEPAASAAEDPSTGAGDAGGAGGSTADDAETVTAGATESKIRKDSIMGSVLIRESMTRAGLEARFTDTISARLPESFTEAEVTRSVESYRDMRVELEKEMLGQRGGLPHVQVTKDAMDARIKKLDNMLAGNLREGYSSLKQAFCDITGYNPFTATDTEDFNRVVLRESIGTEPWDSQRHGRRMLESAQTGTWNLILGDSVTRRMVAEYMQPALQTWRKVVSSIVPVQDFRTQRIERLGGYGVLPTVNQGAPYQPLTTPGNEEADYAINKRGGTEDLTLETIANDDLRMVQLIPKRLGLAAAQTLFRFVWDIFNTNPTYTPDSTALFSSGHNNTAANALSRTAVATARKAMRKQTAYGDAYDDLSIIPKMLITVPDLEELAFEICTSAVAIPTSAPDGGASNIPNLHQGMEPIVIDYWSGPSATNETTTAWYLVGDPDLTPTIELGFYQGRQDPELFIQNDPTVGSVFTADKITWKIRHIYSGTALDFRALQRGNS